MSAKKTRQKKRTSKTGHASDRNPSQEYVSLICRLYGDAYDDREEDSRIRGLDWKPGIKAVHKSMGAFQRELEEVHGIHLSRTKLQKILITGGCWTTERSREVQWLVEEYIAPAAKGGKGMTPKDAVRVVAKHLGISNVSVVINLPYGKVVYGLDEKSSNAKRIERCRERKRRAKGQGWRKLSPVI